MYRILIVEDDEGIASGLKKQLTAWNFQGRCVQDFRHVMAEFSDYLPHLVLLDITLPFLTDITGAAKSARFPKCPLCFYHRLPTI